VGNVGAVLEKGFGQRMIAFENSWPSYFDSLEPLGN
jgi:hypothetical protein